MGETNDLQRMRGLIDKLNEASRRYYDQNESDISDDEWDAMYAELRKLEGSGKKVRTVYAHDQDTGLKLLAGDAWFVVKGKEVGAFLLKADAEAHAKKNGGQVVDFARLKAGTAI